MRIQYIFLFIISVTTGCIMSGCSDKNTPEQNTVTDHEEAEHENGSVTNLSAEQATSIGLETGSIEKKQLTASIKANGILNVPNQNKASVTPLIGGVVKSILVQTGNNVAKGQVIATISNTSFITMQEEFLNTRSKLILAEAEYKRQQELQSGNATALKTVQAAEAELNGLKARNNSLKNQLELVGINTAKLTSDNIQVTVSIKSPISGAISAVMVNIGSYVDANMPIAEVIDNSQLHLDLFVYEKDLPKLKENQTIHFTLTNNPGKEYDAVIYAISNTFEENTKALAVHAVVKGDKSGLINGMNITALVSLEHATVNAVPSDAVVNFQGQDFIFIQLDESNEHQEPAHTHNQAEPTGKAHLTFERIPVRKGTTDIGYSEVTILKDIPVNARVVTHGAFFILAKMTNSGEHEH